MKTIFAILFLSVAALQAQTNTNTTITVSVTLTPAQIEWLDRTIAVTNTAHGTKFTRENYIESGIGIRVNQLIEVEANRARNKALNK